MRFFFTSLLVCWLLNSIAQLPSNIKFTSYTRANGLQEEYITSITQDSRGFLWFGSKEGLIRFDGQYFKSWHASSTDSTKFKNNNTRVLEEYKPGQLIFFSGNDLWQINIYNHQLQQVPEFKTKSFITDFTKLNADKYCVTDPDSLYIINSNFDVLYSVALKNYYTMPALASCFPLHYPYALLFASSSGRNYLFNYETKQISDFTMDNSRLDSRTKSFVLQAYDSSIHRLYLSTYFNGNFYCDIQLPQITNYNPTYVLSQTDGQVLKSVLLPDKMLMQAGQNGLYIIMDPENKPPINELTAMAKPVGPKQVLNIYQAKDGSYWLALPNGISHFSLKQPVINYWQKELGSSSDDDIKSIMKGNDGNIYFLKQTNSLYRYSFPDKAVKRLDSTLNYSWSAINDGNEILAAGGGSKLISYDIPSGKVSYPDFLKDFYTANTDLVTLVFKTRNGDRWYSCNGSAGIIRNPAGTKNYTRYSKTLNPPSFSQGYVHSAAEDSHGNIWWGTNKSSRLLKWDAALQKFNEYAVNELIPQFKLKTGINNLHIDASDNLWIALDGAALIKYNVNTRQGDYYDINKGMPTDAVYGMAGDAKKRLWFGTRKGLCCYLPERDKIVTFTSSDGLPEDNFEGKGIFFDETQNQLYIGAKHSITYFDPDTLLSRSISTQPAVFIDEMLVNGKPVYFDMNKNVILETNENNIEFSFAAPDFNRNNQLIFQYRLNGPGDNWIDLGEKRSVTFNNLSPDNYTFSVRTKYKGNEVWTETTATLSFTIKTPWFKTWWFKTGCVLLAALLIWYLIRSYFLRKIGNQKAAAEKTQAVEKERTRIATDMHDDFGASLSRIKFISEKIQLTKEGDDVLKNDLSKISLYSDEMAEKMNEIVWALNQRYDSYADLVSFCRSYASEYLQDKNIRLVFDQGSIPDKKLLGELRRNIFLVIKEALHNLVKHSQASEAFISFSFNDGIHVEISDNGSGFDKTTVRPFANGLENMKKRMADVKGSIDINGSAGTSIKLTVPV